ncbi:MAG: hypothetical protein CL521_02255 [Actinobacteria bacterium]|nr:hypothetical protein [Actinomycetota bacterium]
MIGMLIFPFLVCVALVLVHAYFGAFVLRRGIIFIDLALAQWAALGYIAGYLMGVHEPLLLFLIGFGFTVLASLVLTLLKPIYQENNLQEAVIGVTYITATALSIAMVSMAGLEGHHIQEMLTGHLLFVQPSEVWMAVGLYALIGCVLLKLHPYFIQPQGQKWDFVFYVLFGLVVTSSVKMVGVLLVFSYLVLPILSVVQSYDSFRSQVKVGWVIGVLSSMLGLWVSFFLDVPPSVAVILVLVLAWVCSMGLRFLFRT